MIEFKKKNGDYILQCELQLDHPRAALFEFFSDARNLEAITPGFLQFKIKSSDLSMRRGLIIDYSLKLYGIPFNWRTQISAWEPSVRFIDEQLKGPYLKWVHEHTFEEIGQKTICRDIVHYRVLGSAIIHQLFVKEKLRKIFTFRQNKLLEFFPSRY